MGGPASPFLWAVAYDPIVAGVAAASGAPCPTYVDDLCGLAVGPVGVGAEHGVERVHEKGRAYADALAAGAADEQEGLLAVGVYDD